MHRLFLIPFLGLLASTAALSDVHRQCIAENSEPLDNDLLAGTWYMMFRFTSMGGMVPSISCLSETLTKPTAEEVAEYKEKYNDPNLPYSLDDNPMLRNTSDATQPTGMITGNNIAKFYILDPKTTSLLMGGYSVFAYRFLSNDYIMFHDCALRGFTRMLYARNRYAPVAEMEELIRNTPELARLQRQRFCATY